MNSAESHEKHNADMETQQPETEKPGLFAVILSVLAALFGVQTEANRKRDFSSGNPLPYIIVFIVLLVLFVFAMVGLVGLVISLNS